MFQDNFVNSKKVNVQGYYDSPALFQKSQNEFKMAAFKKILKEVNLQTYEGKKIPKKDLDKLEKDAELKDQ